MGKEKFSLGQKVFVKQELCRNGNKPKQYDLHRKRYNEREINKEGIVCGKRVISLEGYSDFDDVWYFVPTKQKTVYRVAISMSQQCYVSPEDMEPLDVDFNAVMDALNTAREMIGVSYGTEKISE